LSRRAADYARIPLKIKTDRKEVKAIAEEIRARLAGGSEALTVKLKARSYPIYFQKDGPRALPGLLERHAPASQVVLISNPTVFRLHGRRFQKELEKKFTVHKILIPDGERYKNLKTLAGLYDRLARAKVDRKTPILALGGGVIGDVVGFAAASFLRGVPLVQIPTTLVAQVDSSIGGKTGIDLPQGKNLVGAFHQPRFVLIDEAFLPTLPPRQLRCGLAEVIKYAAIFDAALFHRLEKEMAAILKNSGRGLLPIVRRCCEWKARVVEKDEFDALDIRALLNFGHTLGHAIETLTRYRKYTHGEAVAMGMVFAARKSVARAGLKSRAVERLTALIAAAGLPTDPPAFSKRAWLAALARDKKRVSSLVHFVYLKRIGKAAVIPTPLEKILE
jgi:3-dehydroquinate synthase